MTLFYIKCSVCKKELDVDKDMILIPFFSERNVRLCERSKCIKTYKKNYFEQKKIQEENVKKAIDSFIPTIGNFGEMVLKQFLDDVKKVKENKK